MTQYALPPAHTIDCHCAACIIRQWDEFHGQRPVGIDACEAIGRTRAQEALDRADVGVFTDPPRTASEPLIQEMEHLETSLAEEFEREYQLYCAALANQRCGVTQNLPTIMNEGIFGVPVSRYRFNVQDWQRSLARQSQLDWQKAERFDMLDRAREEGRQYGRQSSLEEGYSASSDLCGPSSSDDSFALLSQDTNEFEGTRYEALDDGDQNDECPSLADVEAVIREAFSDDEHAERLAMVAGKVFDMTDGIPRRLFGEEKAVAIDEIVQGRRVKTFTPAFKSGIAVTNTARPGEPAGARNRLTPQELQDLANAPGSKNPYATEDDGDLNPKQACGDLKTDLSVVPMGAVVQVQPVFKHGAAKYGALNWRNLKVKRRTYLVAALRHILADLEGETIDPVETGGSGLPHVSHAIAGLMILLDAQACGTLVDDRLTPGVAGELMAAQATGAL